MIASTVNPVQRASRIANENSINPPCRKKSVLDIHIHSPIVVKCHHNRKETTLVHPDLSRWRTFESTPGQSIRTWIGPSCRRGQSRGRAGRRGSGLSASSKCSTTLYVISAGVYVGGFCATVPLLMVRAGLHWSRRMSRQMLPLELMLG